MEAVITAIEQEIAQEEATHERAMRQLRELLDAAQGLSGQRADGAAPEAPPSEAEGHQETDTEPEAEAAPEPDIVAGVCQGCGATEAAECACRTQRHSVADLTGGKPPPPADPERYRGERERAPGQQEKGASSARLIGEVNRRKVLLYLVDAYQADRGAAAGAGWRSPAQIREVVGVTKDKIRKHCVALMAAGLVDARGTTKDRRYRATRKARTQSPQEAT